MALFDERPKIKENSFSASDAGQVFRNVAEKIDEGNLPAEVTEVVLQVARLLLTVGTQFAKMSGPGA